MGVDFFGDEDTFMKNAEGKIRSHFDRRNIIAAAASLLIALGFGLQWVELFFSREKSWFFATLFGETWNIITVWMAAAPEHQDVRYWPLLLVITGAAILFSRHETSCGNHSGR